MFCDCWLHLKKSCNVSLALFIAQKWFMSKALATRDNRLTECFSTAGPRPRYRALASILPGHERFSWNLPIYFSKEFSLINVWWCKYSEENKIRECVEKLRPRCWPEETTICYKILLVQWLITNNFIFVNTPHRIHKCTNTLYYSIINY